MYKVERLKTGQITAQPNSGVCPGKTFYQKELRCVNFKNKFFKKPDFDQKSGSERLGDVIDMSERHKASFWM